MPKELDTSNPYDQEFSEEWQDGDPSVKWIKEHMGQPCRMKLGGVTGLYIVDGVDEDGARVTIKGRRKPDHD